MSRTESAFVLLLSAIVAGCAATRPRGWVQLESTLLANAAETSSFNGECSRISEDSYRCEAGPLDLTVKAMSDDVLNRRFPDVSFRGAESANPYTFGNWVDPELGYVPPRFTVFEFDLGATRAAVQEINFEKLILVTDQGDTLRPYKLQAGEGPTLETVYSQQWPDKPRLQATAIELARRTLFLGQAGTVARKKGYVVFDFLDPAVDRVTLVLSVMLEGQSAGESEFRLAFRQSLARRDHAE